MKQKPSSHLTPKLFFAKKSLGQNFLVDPRVKQKIAAACELNRKDVVLEIGPGQGSLTELIAPHVDHVFVIEKDYQLVEQLPQRLNHSNITIIHADVLQHPFESLPDNLKLIGNLPYNIATPIIEKIIHYRRKFSTFYLVLQLEHGQRLAAQPSTKDYGSFTCFVQYYCDIKILFKIKSTAFRPMPKVESCFIRLNFLKQPRYAVKDERILFNLIQKAFQQRRKTIVNSLSRMIEKKKVEKILKELNINLQWRAENLSLEDYVKIVNHLPSL